MIWSMPCGAFTVYAIEDGWFHRDPLEHFPDSDPGAWASERSGEQGIRIGIGCYLISDGDRATVIDTGIGSHAADLPGEDSGGGRLAEALALVGVREREVRLVVHTHLHLDHCAGDLTESGDRMFPNAVYRAHRAELDYWLDTGDHPSADKVRTVIQPLLDEGRLEPFRGATELSSGITAVETFGHTPGHVAISIGSLGTQMLIVGDLAHHPLQVEHPAWRSLPDLDADQAHATRDRVFDQVAGTGTIVAGSHFPPPGMGFIEQLGARRMFVTGTAMQVA